MTKWGNSKEKEIIIDLGIKTKPQFFSKLIEKKKGWPRVTK